MRNGTNAVIQAISVSALSVVASVDENDGPERGHRL